MDRKKMVLWTVTLVFLLLSACSTPQPVAPPPPTDTPTPLATSTPETSEWDYVALGEGMYFAPPYAKLIEDDLGVKVNVYLAGKYSNSTTWLLENLRNDPEFRERLSEAEVVTVAFGDTEISKYIAGPCAGTENLQKCLSEQLTTTFTPNLDAIFSELLTLCKSGTIIRTMTYYNMIYHLHLDTRLLFGDVTLNDCILQVAAKHNIPVAPVYEAIEGPAGDEDPLAKGYVTTEGQLTPLGAEKIAEAYRELGYEPTVP